MELTPELLSTLTKTPFCRPAIAELSEHLSHLTSETAGVLVTKLTEQGEDVALDRLLNVCAYRGLFLDPAVVARSGGVIADLTHLRYCFSRDDAAAIAPLLEASFSEELSWERQALLVRLATELAMRHDSAQDEVRRRLRTLLAEITVHPIDLLVHDTLRMLDSGSLEEGVFPLMTECDFLADLPERPPPTIIGGGKTVRRPIPKIGRNEPCHCGSGKKYKRCCYEKDRELLADASSYAGVTQAQIHENPGVVDDPRVIDSMRAYEVKKLDPSKLSTGQLVSAYYRATDFGLLEIAFDMLVERSKRTDGTWPFDAGHFADLMDHALSRGDVDLAQRARDLTPADNAFVDGDAVDLRFELCTNPGLLTAVEARCKDAFCAPVGERGFRDHIFCDLAHTFHGCFPALEILFARAAVQECPDRFADNELLLGNVHEARIKLGLEPWGDPIDAVFDEAEDATSRDAEDQHRAREFQTLRDQLEDARKQAKRTARELGENEAALSRLKRELAEAAAIHDEPAAAEANATDFSAAEAEATVARLRGQVDNLKAEIGNQQETRQRLRRELDRERQRARRAAEEERSQRQEPEETTDVAPVMPAEDARKVIIPEYDIAFREACRKMAPSIAASAIKAIAAFAVYDTAVWRHTRGIRQLPNIYRVRIGIHHRLLLRWLPGQSVTALDLFPRQDLESWIKRHR